MTHSDTPQLTLKRFFPYRLANLQAAVSGAVGRLYTGRFNLTHQEWRVLATLSEYPELSAKDIATHTNLEKMQVSRAIARMTERGLLLQHPAAHDRRYLRLQLTEKGLQTYRDIVPLVLEREAYLLDALSAEEQQLLDGLLDKLLERTHQLAEQDKLKE
ncbi:MarR family transcriptional regulator [Halomonas sediminis]|uniref:MarR family winged helix-turn-helix transcriptional regulator n=1 Tax=Vreelandella zhuhanensis TaxID=2684210 RepID=UPI0019223EA0|nr:winged helix DNA-binding protein [Halomonas zhuhanensis]